MKRTSIKTLSYAQYLLSCLKYLAFLFSFLTIIIITSQIEVKAFGGQSFSSSISGSYGGYFVYSDSSSKTLSTCPSSSTCTGIQISASSVTEPQEIDLALLSYQDSYIYQLANELNPKIVDEGGSFLYSFASTDATFKFIKNNSSTRYEMKSNVLCFVDLSFELPSALTQNNETLNASSLCGQDQNPGEVIVFNVYDKNNSSPDIALSYVVFVGDSSAYSLFWSNQSSVGYKDYMSLKLNDVACDLNTSASCTTVTSSSLKVDVSIQYYTAPIHSYNVKLCTNTNCSGGQSYILFGTEVLGSFMFTNEFWFSYTFKNLDDIINLDDLILNGTYKVYLELKFLVVHDGSKPQQKSVLLEGDTVVLKRKPKINEFYLTNNNENAYRNSLNDTSNAQIVLDSVCYTASCTYQIGYRGGPKTFATNPNGQYITLSSALLYQDVSITITDQNSNTSTKSVEITYDPEPPRLTVSYDGTVINAGSTTTVSAGKIISIHIEDEDDFFFPYESSPILYSLSTDSNITSGNSVGANISKEYEYSTTITIPQKTSDYLYLTIHALNIWDYSGNKLLVSGSETYSDYYTFILKYASTEQAKVTICDGNDITNSAYNTYVGGAYICELPSGSYSQPSLGMDGIYIFSDNDTYTNSTWSNMYSLSGILKQGSSAYPMDSMFAEFTTKKYYYVFGGYSANSAELPGSGAYEGMLVSAQGFNEDMARAVAAVDGEVFIGTTAIYISSSVYDLIGWGTLEQRYPNPPTFGATFLINPANSRWNYTNTRENGVSLEAGDCDTVDLYLNSTSGSPFTTLECAYNGSTTKHWAAGTITLPSTIVQGTNTLYAIAKNMGGHTTQTSFTFVYDTLAPIVEEFSLMDEGWNNTLDYTLTLENYFSFGINDSKPFYVEIYVDDGNDNGIIYTAGGNGSTITSNSSNNYSIIHGIFTLLNPVYDHCLSITIEDWAGNSYTTIKHVYFGVEPEITSFVVVGNSTANSGYTNQNNVNATITMATSGTYNYTITDTVSGSTTTKVSTSGTFSSKTVTFSLSSTNGTHTIKLVVSNAMGSATATTTIILDTVAPTVSTFIATGNSEAESGYTNTALVNLTITASDNISSTSNLMYKLAVPLCHDLFLNGYGTEKPTELLLCTPGTHMLELYVKDQAGNETTKEEYMFQIIYDSTAPEIKSFSAGTGNGYANATTKGTAGEFSTMPFTFTMSTQDYYTYSITIKHNASGMGDYFNYGGFGLFKTKSDSITFEHASDGECSLNLTVRDKAGNTSTSTTTVYRDTIAPVPTLSGIDVTDGVASEVSFSVTMTDAYFANPLQATGFISSRSNLTTTELAYYESKDSGALKAYSHTVPYATTNTTYYFYALYTEEQLKDPAGNVATYDGEFEDSGTGNMWYYKIFTLNVKGTGDENSNDDKVGGFIGNELELPSLNKGADEVEGNYYNYQIEDNNTIIVIQVEHENTCTNVGTLVTAYHGMILVDDTTTDCRSNILSSIVKYNNLYEYAKIVVINTAPRTNSTNSATSITVNKGEEVSNIGLSFTSVDGESLEVDTLITLNGVKVKEIDTNVPGVYNIRQIAIDSKGRSNRIDKQVIVLDEEVKEEIIVSEEEIEVVEEILVPIVNNTKNVETSSNVQLVNRVAQEVEQVEMYIEKKISIKGYQKNKKIRKTKKEKFSFKLFSKYFFKIYDG